jgi:hypothetical protein
MKYTSKQVLILLIFIPVLSGCRVAYRVLLGVDSTPKWETTKSIKKKAKKYRIADHVNLILDTAAYYKGLKEIYVFEKRNITEDDSVALALIENAYKDDAQPTQFRLFNQKGQEVFKMVNCYIDPPIPMKWNIDGCFDSFPPQTDIESLNEHYFDLNFLLNSSQSLDQKNVSLDALPEAEYYGVILWNSFFKRPSKKLIKTIKDYTEQSNASIQLIFINNHNAHIWQLIDSKTKEEITSTLNEEV